MLFSLFIDWSIWVEDLYLILRLHDLLRSYLHRLRQRHLLGSDLLWLPLLLRVLVLYLHLGLLLLVVRLEELRLDRLTGLMGLVLVLREILLSGLLGVFVAGWDGGHVGFVGFLLQGWL